MESSVQMASPGAFFKKPAIAAVVTGSLVYLANLLGFWAEAQFPLAGIWPANAIFLGILVSQPNANKPLSWVLAIIAYLLAALPEVGSISQAAVLTGLNLITVAVGLTLARLFQRRISPIVDTSGLVTLFAIMIAAAGSAGALGGLIIVRSFDMVWVSTSLLRSATEFANLAIFLPLVIGGRMIKGPPRQREPRDRQKLIRHAVALAVLVASCLVMVALDGPGTFVLYLPALIWCTTRVRASIAFILSALAALWTLTTVKAGIVHLGPIYGHDPTSWEVISFRLGVGCVTIAAIAVVALNAFWRRAHHEQMQRANYDSLTGLLARTQFYESANFALNRGKPGRTNIAIAIEIDRFQAINEAHGEPAGDQVVKAVAELLTENIRKGDIVGRLGGDEFAILLPGAGIEEGSRVAERMRQSIADEHFHHGTTDFSTSVSVGLVEFTSPADFSRMLSLADEALYEAKAAGRNRVVIYSKAVLAEASA
jgi:diguanylate cyclase (GGDEF)-like protein